MRPRQRRTTPEADATPGKMYRERKSHRRIVIESLVEIIRDPSTKSSLRLEAITKLEAYKARQLGLAVQPSPLPSHAADPVPDAGDLTDELRDLLAKVESDS